MLTKKHFLCMHVLQANTHKVTSTKADLSYHIFLFYQAKAFHLIIGGVF